MTDSSQTFEQHNMIGKILSSIFVRGTGRQRFSPYEITEVFECLRMSK